MAQTITFEMTQDEAEQLSDLLDQCVETMRESNERGVLKQAETARLREETRALIQQVEEALDMKTNSQSYEQMRADDESKQLAERAAAARNIQQLQLENQLLKTAAQPLPAPAVLQLTSSADATQADLTLLKQQVASLQAAVLSLNEQRAHDQAEIAQLKTQVTALQARRNAQEN